MQYRKAGKSELELSSLGFGCWQFGSAGADDYWGLEYTQDMANDMVRAAAKAGVTYFDTAEDYAKGASEIQLGAAVQSLAKTEGAATAAKVVIGTKILPNHCDDVAKACEGSLKRLQVKCIDLYMVHWPIDKNSLAHFAAHVEEGKSRDYSKTDADAVTSIPPTVAAFTALAKLQKEGKIKHIGVSNFGVSQLKEALSTGVTIAVNQLCYNLIFRASEMEILPFCEKNGIGVIAYSPLMQGLLAGKWSKADDVPEYRARTRHFSSKRNKSRHGEDGFEELLFEALAGIRKVSEQEGLTMAEMALCWPLQAHPNVVTVIAGCTSAEQLLNNCSSVSKRISTAGLKALDEATTKLKSAMGPNADLWQGGKEGRIS